MASTQEWGSVRPECIPDSDLLEYWHYWYRQRYRWTLAEALANEFGPELLERVARQG